jgi:HD-GYP domain-containing protein (c-di-GMP phosphodiesterase class II)/DNA-binding CsgD family transcriptional regulator
MAARLADLLAGLSRLGDLGFGLPIGTALRSCVLATRLAESLDLSPDDVRTTYYSALLHHVGCVGFASETARLFGDEIMANTAAGRTDASSAADLFTTFLPTLIRGRVPLERLRLIVAALTKGGQWGDEFTTAACEVGRHSARRLGLPEQIQESLAHVFGGWRGDRRAGSLAGDDIPVGARIARLTGIAVLFEAIGGTELARHAARTRAGGMLDPALVAIFDDHALAWLAELSGAGIDVRGLALALEPRPHVTAADPRDVAGLFGDLADLKSPIFVGHSRAVAALATGAAERLALPEATRIDLELAGLLHDAGRVAVSTRIWEHAGPLGVDDWEAVRLHPYQSERILDGSAQLARLCELVGRHHERLDGSGYHRGCSGADLSLETRVLAAADAYQTSIEHRPHRPAATHEQAKERLLAQAARGSLDESAVRAVLASAGHPVRVRRDHPPAELSSREVEVLGLVARGCSNAEIAERLVISRRTAEHHVQHIYTKIGVSSRAAATLFAVEHHLLNR